MSITFDKVVNYIEIKGKTQQTKQKLNFYNHDELCGDLLCLKCIPMGPIFQQSKNKENYLTDLKYI